MFSRRSLCIATRIRVDFFCFFYCGGGCFFCWCYISKNIFECILNCHITIFPYCQYLRWNCTTELCGNVASLLPTYHRFYIKYISKYLPWLDQYWLNVNVTLWKKKNKISCINLSWNDYLTNSNQTIIDSMHVWWDLFSMIDWMYKILKMHLSILCYWLVTSYHVMIMPPYQYNGTLLMTSHHWFR